MHTHFTRLPHQRVAKKVPPPPLLGRWLLMLGVLLMTWGLVPQVVRADTDPKDVAKLIGLDNIAMSEARPYIEFHYMDYDKDNRKPDAMRNIKIYARAFDGYTTVVDFFGKEKKSPFTMTYSWAKCPVVMTILCVTTRRMAALPS